MRRRRKDIAIASRCAEASFILKGEDETEYIEGAETFKYLGRMLDRSDSNWTTVRYNSRKERRVWNWLGKLTWREGEDPRVSEMFYREVVQAVLLFGEDTWVLLAAMYQKM